MALRFVLSRLLVVFLLPLAITSSVYLYLYPVFSGCAHPLPQDNEASPQTSAFLNTLRQHLAPQSAQEPAIFRLLVLADPQLEGDSSLPRPEDELGARIQKHWSDILSSIDAAPLPFHVNVRRTVSTALRTLVAEDLPRAWAAARKRLDLFGNDYYLAHIYRTLHWWTRPTHVAVLGDLIGSQWVTDEEFHRRGQRYWQRVFRGGERVSDEITRTGKKKDYHHPGDDQNPAVAAVEEELAGPHTRSQWANRIINVAGNHDIGYSGDASAARIQRFEDVFGRADWDVRFRHPQTTVDGRTPTLHLINLNSLTLDSPPFSDEIQSRSYDYINDVISHRSSPVEDRTTFTLLLTHVPLHKRQGLCTDGPYFTFFDADDTKDPDAPRFRAGGLREQNHLSEHVSTTGILQGIFGLSGDPQAGRGRNGLILTGHDHAGCDVVHFIESLPHTSNTSNDTTTIPDESPAPSWTWSARRYDTSSAPQPATDNDTETDRDTPSIREITLRAMMGEYGGNAGLVSIWFDFGIGEWKYAVSMCPAGVQHIWWAVHVVDLITLGVLGVYGALVIVGGRAATKTKSENGNGYKNQKIEVR